MWGLLEGEERRVDLLLCWMRRVLRWFGKVGVRF
jgi:hypothetical protein